MKSVIVGTAGHIDHGKTALVKALTGIDADRLQEEKRRGITIDIGFAHLELTGANGERLRLGFVDVPGHERFVRNMLAGVGGIDLVLLVIAADESIKPQTREHFDICRMLNIRRGITVLTKADLVDRETLDVVRLEVEEFLRGSFLEGAPIVAVSSKTGEGLDELKRRLAQSASEITAKDTSAALRLPIDRVFTMKGFGTVVTGTLLAGKVKKEEELEVFPTSKRVRVRGIQVHGAAADEALAGQRTALNLAGVTTEELARGMMLAPASLFRATKRVDVQLTLLPQARPLRDRARVHFHAYTAETIAEVVLLGSSASSASPALKPELPPGQTAFAQLRLAEALLLLPGDRFILRQFSPVVTIGGGFAVDAAPLFSSRQLQSFRKLSPGGADNPITNVLELLARSTPELTLAYRAGRRGPAGLSVVEAVAETGFTHEKVEKSAKRLIERGALLRFGDRFFGEDELDLASRSIIDAVNEFHQENPLATGISRRELGDDLKRVLSVAPELFEASLNRLVNEKKLEFAGEQVRQAGRGVVMKDEEAESKRQIEQAFATAGLKVPALKDVLAGLKVDRTRAQKIVTLLLRDRILVKVAEDLVFHRDALDALRKLVAEYKAKSPKIDVAKFKDLTGVSRKYAIPLLEYLDRERVTKRAGDERVIL